jgi:hypothetical protein
MSYFKVGLIGFLVGYYSLACLEKRNIIHIKNNNTNDIKDNKIYTNIKLVGGILSSCSSLIIHSILLK